MKMIRKEIEASKLKIQNLSDKHSQGHPVESE